MKGESKKGFFISLTLTVCFSAYFIFSGIGWFFYSISAFTVFAFLMIFAQIWFFRAIFYKGKSFLKSSAIHIAYMVLLEMLYLSIFVWGIGWSGIVQAIPLDFQELIFSLISFLLKAGLYFGVLYIQYVVLKSHRLS